jgi:hypothetical protein
MDHALTKWQCFEALKTHAEVQASRRTARRLATLRIVGKISRRVRGELSRFRLAATGMPQVGRLLSRVGFPEETEDEVACKATTVN